MKKFSENVISVSLLFLALAGAKPYAQDLPDDSIMEEFKTSIGETGAEYSYTKQNYILDETGRENMRMSVDVYRQAGNPGSGKIVFVMHGRNGNAAAPHMMLVINAYLQKGYTVIAPNARNSHWNDSDGQASDFTIATHVEDLERAVKWARQNADELGWNGQRFSMAGHSMGAFAICYLAATEYSGQVEHLIVISPFTSGENQLAARKQLPGGMRALREEVPHAPEEWMEHDIYEDVEGLTMPVSIIVGESDNITPVDDVRKFYESLPGPGIFEIIEGQHHTIINENLTQTILVHIERLNGRVADNDLVISVGPAKDMPASKAP